MKLNEIKIELFDKCHDLVFEYLNTHGEQIKDESIGEFHLRHGKLMREMFEDLSKGKLN